jgi:hypothetical protein
MDAAAYHVISPATSESNRQPPTHRSRVRAAGGVPLERKLHDAVAAAAVRVGRRAARAAALLRLLDQLFHHLDVLDDVLLEADDADLLLAVLQDVELLAAVEEVEDLLGGRCVWCELMFS